MNEYSERIFTHSEVYFSSPLDFNDPFDCRIPISLEGSKEDYKAFYNRMYKKMRPELSRYERRREISQLLKTGKHKNKEFLSQIDKTARDDIINNVGVYCLSEVCDDILMWSHYSYRHAGFCLQFEATDYTPFFGEAQKVKYTLEYPKLSYFKSNDDDLLYGSLLTKSSHWEYEKEWRVIFQQKGVHTFPEELLKGVICGCQMTEENKKQITSWLQARPSSVVLYDATKKDSEFGLDICRIDNYNMSFRPN